MKVACINILTIYTVFYFYILLLMIQPFWVPWILFAPDIIARGSKQLWCIRSSFKKSMTFYYVIQHPLVQSSLLRLNSFHFSFQTNRGKNDRNLLSFREIFRSDFFYVRAFCCNVYWSNPRITIPNIKHTKKILWYSFIRKIDGPIYFPFKNHDNNIFVFGHLWLWQEGALCSLKRMSFFCCCCCVCILLWSLSSLIDYNRDIFVL